MYVRQLRGGLFLVLGQPVPVSACTCGDGPYVCSGIAHASRSGEAVFVGTVISIANVHGAIGRPGQRQSVILERRVRLQIHEAFTKLRRPM
jgi:hypothetical protein